ncbi:MAG: ABC transporter permease, partial [Spirochaetota bacterium]
SWFLASLGVFLRDMSQLIGFAVTIIMFVSPVFYPASALPPLLRKAMILNPIAEIVEQFRAVIIGIPVVVSYLLIATHFAPLYTRLSAQVGALATDSYAGQITAFADGGNPLRFWFFYLFQGNPFALGGVPVVAALMFVAWKRNKKELME